jgi:hypothetical protein
MMHRETCDTGSETDRGSITPLGIFGAVLTLGLALTLANASAVLTQQRFLESVAQGIALDAAGQVISQPLSPVTITDGTNELLLELSTQNSALTTRLAEARVVSGLQNIDGSVAIKICQPPRILFMNQVLVSGNGFANQVCARAAAIKK